jgi:transposase
MPRNSPFSIKLTRRERAELIRLAGQYRSAYRDVIQAKIVLLASEGLANDVIGARLDTPRQIVSKWRQRFNTHRLSGLEDQPRSGRPAHFFPAVRVEIKALACELPSRRGVPLARWSLTELRREAVAQGLMSE